MPLAAAINACDGDRDRSAKLGAGSGGDRDESGRFPRTTARRRTSRCSGRSRRWDIDVTSTNRSCGARAAERQSVRRATTAGWGSELERVGRRGRGWQLGKSICPAHRRDSCHLEGSIEASVECLVVGNEVVVVSSASRRRDLVEDLEVELERRGSGSEIGVERSPCRRTSRCSGRGPVNSRSVFSEPGPRGSVDE